MATPLSVQKALAEAYELRSTTTYRRGLPITFPREDTNAHCINILICQTSGLAGHIQSEFHEFNTQMQERKTAIWNLEVRTQNLENRTATIEAAAAAVAARVSRLDAIDFAAMDTKILHLGWWRDAHQKSIQDFGGRIVEAEKTLKEFGAAFAQVQTDQAAMRKDVDQLRVDQSSASQEIGALKALLSQEGAKATGVEQRLRVVEGQYASKAALEQYKKAATDALEGLRTDFEVAKRMTEQQQDADRKALAAMQLQQATLAASSQVTTLEKRVSLKVDTAVHDQQIASTEREVDTLKKENEQLRSKLNELEKTVAMLVASMQGSQREAESAKAETKSRFSGMDVRLEGLNKEMGKLRTSIVNSARDPSRSISPRRVTLRPQTPPPQRQ